MRWWMRSACGGTCKAVKWCWQRMGSCRCWCGILAAELERVIKENPFAAEAAADGARVHAVFLSEVHPAAKAKELQQIVTRASGAAGSVSPGGRHAVSAFAGWGGRVEVPTAQSVELDRGSGTARNWNTVLKLCAMSAR